VDVTASACAGSWAKLERGMQCRYCGTVQSEGCTRVDSTRAKGKTRYGPGPVSTTRLWDGVCGLTLATSRRDTTVAADAALAYVGPVAGLHSDLLPAISQRADGARPGLRPCSPCSRGKHAPSRRTALCWRSSSGAIPHGRMTASVRRRSPCLR